MTDIISRLLDEADKAQRKGNLILAEVCRDASDKIGLLANELADMTSDYLRRHKDACDRMAEIEQLQVAVNDARNGAVAASECAGRMMEDRDEAFVEIARLRSASAEVEARVAAARRDALEEAAKAAMHLAIHQTGDTYDVYNAILALLKENGR